MKSLLTIQLTPDLEVTIKKGSLVKAGDIIAKRSGKIHKEKIPLGKILSIDSKRITSFIVKKLGSKVKKGEILAKKEGMFKSVRVLSPFSGILESVDLKDGSLLLVSQEVTEVLETSPLDGFVEGATGEEITISFEGKVIEGEKGKGERAIGYSLVFKEHVDMHHFTSEVSGKIVIGKTFTEGARAKLNALGAKGLVSLEYYEDFPVSVKLSEKSLKELVNVHNKNIILLGQLNRIIIPVAL